ncbi:hypothetical protein H4R33_002978 [Dimargaris cristalligena]|nr:hypothetical protein H4R33_002978 [Dimargaris cristalligena]
MFTVAASPATPPPVYICQPIAPGHTNVAPTDSEEPTDDLLQHLNSHQRSKGSSVSIGVESLSVRPYPSNADVDTRLSSSSSSTTTATTIPSVPFDRSGLTPNHPFLSEHHLRRSNSLKDLLTNNNRRHSGIHRMKSGLGVRSLLATADSPLISPCPDSRRQSMQLELSSPTLQGPVRLLSSKASTESLQDLTAGRQTHANRAHRRIARGMRHSLPGSISLSSTPPPPSSSSTDLPSSQPSSVTAGPIEAENKVALKKLIVKGLARMGIDRNHSDFKDVWNQVYKSCQFTLRKELPVKSLTQLDMVAVVEKHIELFAR